MTIIRTEDGTLKWQINGGFLINRGSGKILKFNNQGVKINGGGVEI